MYKYSRWVGARLLVEVIDSGAQPAKDYVQKGSERFYARNQGRSLEISCHPRVAYRSYSILFL
jgi:hypothetical protein